MADGEEVKANAGSGETEDHDQELHEVQKLKKLPSLVVSELVKCNEDDPDALDEGVDPESFDDVFELA